MKTDRLHLIISALSLMLLAEPAFAWGLYTHTWFAQLTLAAVPLSHPAFRRAAAAFPRLVMAGASLPDLALLAGWMKTPSFRASHDWDLARQMLASPQPADQAIALGYASHLLVDVIAHHHFVPDHEQRWFNWPTLTHALCEWAMDRHIADRLQAPPAELLLSQSSQLAPFVAHHFHCPQPLAEQAIRRLAHADQGLRRGRLPSIIYRSTRRIDKRLVQRFDDYLHATAQHLTDLNRLIDGHFPLHHPNGVATTAADQPALIPASLFA